MHHTGPIGLTVVPAIAIATLGSLTPACNTERKQECDKFLSAMQPLAAGMPSAAVVDRVRTTVDAVQFQDEPLREYAKNYKEKLVVLSSTLALKDTTSAPEGLDDLINSKLKAARTDASDIGWYCSQ
jgi:hypothetical protein